MDPEHQVVEVAADVFPRLLRNSDEALDELQLALELLRLGTARLGLEVARVGVAQVGDLLDRDAGALGPEHQRVERHGPKEAVLSHQREVVVHPAVECLAR